MPKLTIDNREVHVEPGSTILEAAEKFGIDIPTMCFLAEREASASCGVCVVKVVGRDDLTFACAAPAEEGMAVLTDTDEVRDGRRTALELLLGDHLGDCVAPCRMACPVHMEIPRIIRLIADGNIAGATDLFAESGSPCLDCRTPCEKACRRHFADGAVSIRRLMLYLAGETSTTVAAPKSAGPKPRPFSVHVGKPVEGEMEKFLAEGSDETRVEPVGEKFSATEARREAGRCLHCDCRKADACKLRSLAREYGAKPARFRTQRRTFEQDTSHPEVIYEPGKCIDCGICVRLAQEAGEQLGLTFVGRGFSVRISVPFGAGMVEGLRKAALRCANACPTGALAMRRS